MSSCVPKLVRLLLACVALPLVFGCGGSPSAQDPSQALENASGNEAAAHLASPSLEPTATLTPVPAETAPSFQLPAGRTQAEDWSAPPAVQRPDPVRFSFPTPGPMPVAAWRPPLYPVPWEPTSVDHFYFARPIAANEINWPLADYRYGGVFFRDNVHTGVDIPAPTGTPILAAGPGRVMWAGYGLYALREDPNDPYGLAVAIRHDFGYDGERLFTVYGHMEKINVMEGDYVETGDILGWVGETGVVTGPHLHFEVRMSKNNFFGTRNPELWIAPPQGWGVLAGRVMRNDGDPLDRHSVYIRSVETNQHWEVKTYGKGSTNSDPYYRENVVIGDLPAGMYEIWLKYLDATFNQKVEIRPGMVTYFQYHGGRGFSLEPPPLPGSQFSPYTPTPTSRTAP